MKRVLVITVLSILLLVPVAIFAQTGTIAGQVTIEKTGNPLANAAVYLGDSKTGTYAKKNGQFTLKNVPVGTHTVTVSFMGYAKQMQEVDVMADETAVVKFEMVVEAVKLGGMKVSANRAVKRETPIAFTDLSQEEMVNKYTTQDVPGLLEGVPGLFSTGGGLGEGELLVRGFGQDKVQIMINGIPVNDPESQQVYWSNWTGLSSNIKSVQVQRGAGSSMYGSGVFGGSVNIETIGSSVPAEEWVFRTSGGIYSVPDKVADGKGGMIDWTPYNYNMLARYNSGNLYGGKFNYSIMAERKLGESWQIGTYYDGWSFGVDTQHLWGDHSVNMSVIAAPQKHNQMRSSTDMELMDHLGRAYNRNNNPEQLNYYHKPQFSVRDEWKLSDDTMLMTNVFITSGDGGGKYLKNDLFDVGSGKVYYKDVSQSIDDKYFGRHAYDIAINHGIALDGIEIFYNTVNPTVIDSVHFNGEFIDYGYNLPNKDFNHTYTNDSQNNHKQFGFNTYLDHKINDMIKIVVGGEWRYWRATHIAQSWNMRYNGGVYAQHQDRYNYDGIVSNLSGFVRAQIQPIPELTLLLDGQYASYSSRVEENPIQIFDYQKGLFTDNWIYATKDNFEEEDYEKTFEFLSPKAGVNYNITEYLNVLANFSIANKEPRLTDWYSRSGGPDDYQTWTDSLDVTHVEELDPEKAITMEFGIGYEGVGWNLSTNFYMTDYEDKLESTYLEEGETVTINAGSARHQGVELAAGFLFGNIDGNISATYAQNRWTEVDVDEIFGKDAEDIVDKVVPFSPEQMANFGFGYTFNLPGGDLRIGLSGNWWDEYYGSYTNDFYTEYDPPVNYWEDPIPVESSLTDAKLPYFFALNSDISYAFKLGSKNASIRLDLKSINNREDNYTRAYWGKDYGRDDILNGINYMYVTPAPLFNAFLTAEVKF
jgi:outer membrane receptor protein involved in Fe transport